MSNIDQSKNNSVTNIAQPVGFVLTKCARMPLQVGVAQRCRVSARIAWTGTHQPLRAFAVHLQRDAVRRLPTKGHSGYNSSSRRSAAAVLGQLFLKKVQIYFQLADLFVEPQHRKILRLGDPQYRPANPNATGARSA
ncbi:MAG TPA: hypothetical protein VMQ86_22180 [Bryobacteraceae bacterium]|nr:hypothetical protein [Bryobacteraceae bacterium]